MFLINFEKKYNMKINKLIPNPDNPRKISREQLLKLGKSIQSFEKMMAIRKIIIDENMMIIGGNQRYTALKTMGYKEIPDEWIEQITNLTEDEKREFIIKDNAPISGEWDWEKLAGWGDETLGEWGLEMQPTPEKIKAQAHESLKTRFAVPPLSILDTRQGYWIDRKKNWKILIGDDGQSRENTLSKSLSRTPNYYDKKAFYERKIGRLLTNKEFESEFFDEAFAGYDRGLLSGASIFDPVVAEIITTWFGIKNGTAFDCFAGGVFGFVSDYLGMKFTGTELRQEQCDINNKRLTNNHSKYICDDGRNIGKYLAPESQDLLFSCPPYFDLEIYSDDPRDASNQKDYVEFMKIITQAFTESIKLLKNNRFAVIVVGDIRDKTGLYYRFHDHIKNIFEANGMRLYNELILIETVGSAAMRVNGAMKSRKVPKVHQNVLAFYKGTEVCQIAPAHNSMFVFLKGTHKDIPVEFEEIITEDQLLFDE